ncbi:MAG TPA: glycosyltransferase family 2 protein [Vicinamibacterales bacterium]|nr:glycosyltransferase family 2 protein [Vicinamibacterales bacterium]
MALLFWVSAFVVCYVYAGYPLCLAAWARINGRRPRTQAPAAGAWPSVSLVVAVRNEASRLAGRIANLLDQRYPGPLEVLVVSDGSDDDPASALAGFADAVRLIERPRGGKPLALNAGVAAARGEILVFADARQRFAPGAIEALVSNFSDPAVGGATGELVLDCERAGARAASTVGDGLGLYWQYEKWLRRRESHIWSTLGATGAIYALRRTLWRPLPADTLLDDVLAPMRAVLAGYRLVFDGRAVAFDRAAPDAATEARRKQRTLAGNYQILALEPRLLVPVVNPVWLQYMSHKVGRLIVPWALLGLLVSSIALARSGWFYAGVVALEAAFYGLALAGAWLDRRASRPPAAPAVPIDLPRSAPEAR